MKRIFDPLFVICCIMPFFQCKDEKVTEYIIKENPSNYEFVDNIRHTLTVNSDGTGDFKTINEAYSSIKESCIDNQYEIIVYPGTYEEGDLIPPPYTHTRGHIPNSVKVWNHSSRFSYVFDLQNSCKLSNLCIEKDSGSYCIHCDNPNEALILVNNNLKLILGANAGCIVGGGSCSSFICKWINCEFRGEKSSQGVHFHSQVNSLSDFTKVSFRNCVFNTCIRLGGVGGYGLNMCEITGCSFVKGSVCGGWISFLRNIDNYELYLANNWEWNIVGGNNKNFCLNPPQESPNHGEAFCFESKNYNERIVLSGSAVQLLFGDQKKISGGIRIKGKAIGNWDIRDVISGQSPYTSETIVIPLWRRLGDCSIENRDVIVKTINLLTNKVEIRTYKFTENYELSQKEEDVIIKEINESVDNAVLYKLNAVDNYDNVHMNDKVTLKCLDIQGILKTEIVRVNNGNAYRATHNTSMNEISGIALNDAPYGEYVSIWTGNYYFESFSDGEYGITSDSKLGPKISNRAGHVFNNVFYPYY